MEPATVLEFWFSERVRRHWFGNPDRDLDLEIRNRFEDAWRAAARGVFAAWEASPEGALALVLLLDQFPLHMFRGRPEAWSTEALARQVARRAIGRGHDRALDDDGRRFLYLPFMHSEDLADQDRAVALYERAGLEDAARWARHHREIIRRFGRFPHRNAALGRETTPEEAAWLASPDAFHG